MCANNTRKDLNLTPVSNSTCGCCSTETALISSASSDSDSDSPETAGTSYALEGLTCGHCVNTAETAISAVAGVESATVELVAGGISTLSIIGDARMAQVQAAVENAGYTLTRN
ncbi:heavy-metal-associated domain-containing protein [Arthrobacter polaris]|uniref:heavy-metal-associated domain-containing protein n=1 Tax=Arthrobacter polaris TaxID=2813727 RepID=UPI001F31CDF2|nr:heavy metal-associated domain-containing protein [Arthrobacter polaris]UIK89813.1 heavy-metal-associated domain-containing protein [Arthrobacter polaris]